MYLLPCARGWVQSLSHLLLEPGTSRQDIQELALVRNGVFIFVNIDLFSISKIQISFPGRLTFRTLVGDGSWPVSRGSLILDFTFEVQMIVACCIGSSILQAAGNSVIVHLGTLLLIGQVLGVVSIHFKILVLI